MSTLGEALNRAKEGAAPRGAVLVYFRADGTPLEFHWRHYLGEIDRDVARELVASTWPRTPTAVRALAVVLYPDKHVGAPVDFRFEAKPMG
jgi:hypothetical protein